MTIPQGERAKMRGSRSIGPRMIAMLEAIGIESLAELADADAQELAFRINVQIGSRHINQQGVKALQYLIDLAKQGESGR